MQQSIITSVILLLFYCIGYIESEAIVQGENLILTINPGATASDSQNPITPRNITVSVGTTVTWINKDSTYHRIVSGTPDKGPSNIFYGDSFGTGETYKVTLNALGVYSYYDPTWTNINGHITIVPGNNTIPLNSIHTQQGNIVSQQST